MIIEPPPSPARLSFDLAERGELIVPCPLVWRGRVAFSSTPALPEAASLNRASSDRASSNPVQLPALEAPVIVVRAGVGPAKLLVSWAVPSAADPHHARAPVPVAYVIESSGNSTNGRDGDWRHELSVTQNVSNARTHVIEFDGQSWVRLTLRAAAPAATSGEALPAMRLDLHDASDGTDDCWLALGDRVLAGVHDEAGWAELIHEGYPGYFPAVIDETVIHESLARTLERLPGLLELHAPARRVAMAFGDGFRPSEANEAGALEALVSAVLESGRLPVLARRPAAPGGAREGVDAFNLGIAALERRHRLVPGPDLAAWFDAHPSQLDGDGRPTPEGRRAVARLWAEALDVWYVPQ